MGYLMALGAVSGGITGYMDGQQQNDKRAQMMHAFDNLPKVPNLRENYLDGYEEQMKATPKALKLEQKMRQKYLPQQMELGADLYEQYLPRFATANMNTLRKVDPQFLQGRNQLYGVVSRDLDLGSTMGDELEGEVEDYLRGAQAARGNVLGNAPASAEAFAKGRAGQDLKQRRMDNMRAFLAGPSPEDKFAQLAGGGAGVLAAGTGAAVAPPGQYVEQPRNWGEMFYRAAADEYGMRNGQAMAKGNAAMQAPPETNPWLASLAGSLGGMTSMAGGMGGGGGAGGKA